LSFRVSHALPSSLYLLPLDTSPSRLKASCLESRVFPSSAHCFIPSLHTLGYYERASWPVRAQRHRYDRLPGLVVVVGCGPRKHTPPTIAHFAPGPIPPSSPQPRHSKLVQSRCFSPTVSFLSLAANTRPCLLGQDLEACRCPLLLKVAY
jgi:hypothetical protein